MGLAAVAGHLVILVALVSAGTVLVATLGDRMTDQVDAQAQALQRLRTAANEGMTLADARYAAGADRVDTNWTNDGSEEIRTGDLTLLVDGVWTDPDTVDRFQVTDDPASSVWAPGETLELRVQGQGDAHLALVSPHGTAAYRRS